MSLLALAGCTGMHTQFDCSSTGGIKGCASLGQVNRLADQGTFSRRTTVASKTNSSSLNTKPTGSWQKTPNIGKPLRASETVQNIWIAPYETKDGSYSWPSMMSIVLRPGHWIDSPKKEIQKSGEF